MEGKGEEMKISTEEMINRIMKFCKKNEFEIKTLSVKEEVNGFDIDLVVIDGD